MNTSILLPFNLAEAKADPKCIVTRDGLLDALKEVKLHIERSVTYKHVDWYTPAIRVIRAAIAAVTP